MSTPKVKQVEWATLHYACSYSLGEFLLVLEAAQLESRTHENSFVFDIDSNFVGAFERFKGLHEISTQSGRVSFGVA
jgi:hypothetical protein